MRLLCDLGYFYNFPRYFLAIGMVSILGPGPSVAIFAVALTSMPTFARLTRSIAISTKEMELLLLKERWVCVRF